MLQHATSHTDAVRIHRKTSVYNYMIVAFAAIGSIIYGFDSSVIATTLGQPTFYTYFGLAASADEPGYDYTTQITGACNALAQVGGFFGCFVNAWSADRLGRVKSFQIAAAFCIVGAAIQSAAVNVPMLLVFRFINGLGVGMLLVIVPMYQSELSPPHARGFLVGQHGLFLAIGYNLAAWTGFGCFWAKNGDFAWRFPLAAQVIFPIILLAGSFWMPQSPRWLITQERNEEACTIIKRLHSSPDDPGDTFATAEYNQMVAQIQFESIKRNGSFGFISSAKLLMQKPSYRKRAFLGFGIMFGAQCTGVLVINNYQVTLFPGLGVSPAMSLALYCIYLFIALIGNGTCGFIVDRLGRRKMLLIGLVGSCFALVGETIFASLSEHTNNRAILGLAVFFIFAYIPFFSTFVDTTQYIYMSEIFPSEVRSHGVALSVSGQWLATICFLQSAPTAFANIGYKFYLVFIACTVTLFFLVYFFYPETQNLSLEEMAKVFGDDVIDSLEQELEKTGCTVKTDINHVEKV